MDDRPLKTFRLRNVTNQLQEDPINRGTRIEPAGVTSCLPASYLDMEVVQRMLAQGRFSVVSREVDEPPPNTVQEVVEAKAAAPEKSKGGSRRRRRKTNDEEASE